MNFVKLAATAVAFAFAATAAVAQAPVAPTAPKPPVTAAPTTPAPTTTAPTVAKKAGVPTTATTPEGIACSAEADTKGLHGKPRRSFRAKCIKEKTAAMAKKN